MTESYILTAIRDVVEAGTVHLGEEVLVPETKLNRLKEVLGFAEETNKRSSDLAHLNKLVHEVSQSAANPRPLSGLLFDLVHTVMRDGGNPSYQKSPQIRLVLHQLLWLLDSSSLPAYGFAYDDPRRIEYGKDCDAVEQLYKQTLSLAAAVPPIE